MSVQYRLDRDADGEVVKPTWLLTTTCTVPPWRYPRSWERLGVSATTPCPANAASPCIRSGSTVKPDSPLLSLSCLARAITSRTGSTASKCDGLAVKETATWAPLGARNVPFEPRWYFTSPEP